MKTKLFGKNFASLLVLIVLVFSSCSSKITMEKIIDANSMKELLKHYENFTEVSEIGLVSYGNKDFLYIGDEEFQEIYTKDVAYSHAKFEEFPYSAEFPIDCGEWMGLRSIYSWFGFNYDLTELEEILSVKKSGDVLYVETLFSSENLKKYARRLDIEYTEGDYGINIYEIDKKTLAILGMEGKIYRKDDSVSEVVPSVKTYFNQKMPKEAALLFDYVSNIKEKRTVTLVLNPGTENERTEKTFTAKGDPLSLVWGCASDGVWDMFTDYECTKPISSSASDGKPKFMDDVTVYVKKIIED